MHHRLSVVLKAAFIVGGSYGRGAMTCRSGEHFTGPWSAPTMMALKAKAILDCSASQGVARHLAIDLTSAARRCSLFLNPADCLAILSL